MIDRSSEAIIEVMKIIKIIPDYQRDFVWSQKELTSFFNDIMESFINEEDYFIGSMVFEKIKSTTSYQEEYLLVDGQQRVTSLFLLFGLSLKIMRKRGHEKRTRLTHMEVDLISDVNGDPKLKSNSNPEITQTFEILFDEEKSSFESQTTNLAIRAIYKAASTIENLIKENFLDTAEDNNQFIKFINFVINNVTFSYYTSKSQLESLIVFERLNSSGKSLSELEIAKGSLFIQVEKNESKWDTLKAKWAELMNLIGKSGIKTDKTFIRHFIATEYKEFILQNKKYKGNGLLKPSEIITFITDKSAPLQSSPINTADQLISFTTKLMHLSDGKDTFGRQCVFAKNISELSNSKVHNILILQSKDEIVYRACASVSLAQTTINKLLGKYVGGTEARFEAWSKMVFEGYNKNNSPEKIAKDLCRDALYKFHIDWKEVEPKFENFEYNSNNATLCLKILELVLDKKIGSNKLANGLASDLFNKISIDHIEPRNSNNFKNYGGDNIGNLALLNGSSNSAIGDKLYETDDKKLAYKNSGYTGTIFMVPSQGSYGGKEGKTYENFPQCKTWDAEQSKKRQNLIKESVRSFTLDTLEEIIS
ncbi:DUF262 domain-containing HNH endonuclease family protein [Amylibacter sp.]|nr:DUF262 domain-containing HNH endonuclease family protein [Amylibacter sp.]